MDGRTRRRTETLCLIRDKRILQNTNLLESALMTVLHLQAHAANGMEGCKEVNTTLLLCRQLPNIWLYLSTVTSTKYYVVLVPSISIDGPTCRVKHFSFFSVWNQFFIMHVVNCYQIIHDVSSLLLSKMHYYHKHSIRYPLKSGVAVNKQINSYTITYAITSIYSR